jgi:outer membrane protein assembly factor BamB
MTRRTQVLRAGVVVGMSLLAGCLWPVQGQGPNRQAHNDLETAITVDTVASLAPAWSAPVDEGPVGDPVTSAAGIHVNDTRAVYGFDPATGARRWRYGVAAPATMDQPLVNGDRLIANMRVPDDFLGHGAHVGLDPATGAALSGEDVERVLAVRGDRFVSFDDFGFPRLLAWEEFLSVVDTTTGQEICCHGLFYLEGQAPTHPQLTLGSSLVLHGGPGLLTFQPPGGLHTFGNGVRAYALDGSVAPCSSAELAAACATWTTRTDGTTTTAPVLSDDETTAYVGTDAGTVYAVDTATGAVRWTASVGSAVTDAPALAGGRLFVPTAAGDLLVVRAAGCQTATCAPLWRGTTGSAITQQPAVAGGVVFTGSADGSLRAFPAGGCGRPSCLALWAAFTGSAITGAPAVSAGHLYAGTADGRVVAYTLP